VERSQIASTSLIIAQIPTSKEQMHPNNSRYNNSLLVLFSTTISAILSLSHSSAFVSHLEKIDYQACIYF
jgi:hypothetical protein